MPIKNYLYSFILLSSLFLACNNSGQIQPNSDKKQIEDPGKEENFNFAFIGHSYPVLFNGSEEQVNRFIGEVEKCQPDAIIFGGDAILGLYDQENKGMESIDALMKQYEQLKNLFSHIEAPIWIAPGNHELVTLPGLYKEMEELFNKKFGGLYYAEKIANNSFFMLNTVNISLDHNSYEYSFNEKQINWLAKELESSSSNHNFVFIHHPLWYAGDFLHPGNGTMPAFDWQSKIHPLLNEKVQFVFAGDGGYYGNLLFHERINGINYYVSGSNKDRASFLDIQIIEDKIDVQPHFVSMR